MGRGSRTARGRRRRLLPAAGGGAWRCRPPLSAWRVGGHGGCPSIIFRTAAFGLSSCGEVGRGWALRRPPAPLQSLRPPCGRCNECDRGRMRTWRRLRSNSAGRTHPTSKGPQKGGAVGREAGHKKQCRHAPPVARPSAKGGVGHGRRRTLLPPPPPPLRSHPRSSCRHPPPHACTQRRPPPLPAPPHQRRRVHPPRRCRRAAPTHGQRPRPHPLRTLIPTPGEHDQRHLLAPLPATPPHWRCTGAQRPPRARRARSPPHRWHPPPQRHGQQQHR